MQRLILTVFVAVSLAACASGKENIKPESQVSLEVDVNRPGSDYKSFDLEEPQASVCRNKCAAEQQCVAFSYTRPGNEGQKARCFLKNKVPEAVKDPCCYSGVKAGAMVPAPAPAAEQTAPKATP